ncbi:F-box/kelch-repeat protein At2g44130 isoform X2 [Cryptomeria japonica]|uniref:F-box/kelch-repeat protein At2g44130 isoform X2 n=1 Tax=Cryptomeria japonica TaxID=3369 RepID=UPI0027D9EE11|nr:F-box/kelch-repeat protein At2g44130 isoform X2 [Cryptomeria japonica]
MEIIVGLSADLGMQCLARVPYRFHANLRVVSKTWNALLSCHGECEEGVVSFDKSQETESEFDVIIYYPRGNWWERLPQVPTEFELEYTIYHRCVFVRLTQELVVIGLKSSSRIDTEAVLIFDFLSRRWRLGANMACILTWFACAASPSKGLVYVDRGYPFLEEAFVYNVEENKWDFLPPLDNSPLCAISVGVFLDGKFYVASYESYFAEVYDPHSRLWKDINIDCNADYIHCCVAAVHKRSWLTWSDFARGWIDVSWKMDTGSNSQSRAERFAVARRRGDFLASVVHSTNRVEYYTFNPRAREERDRWRRLGCHDHEVSSERV